VVANTVEFSEVKEAIHVLLSKEMGQAKLTIINSGSLLLEGMQGRLFESMVSVRGQNKKKETHFGIGLYIAHVIAEFNQEHITVENNMDNSGVITTLWLPLIPHTTPD